jgi:dienelactone hydrolase
MQGTNDPSERRHFLKSSAILGGMTMLSGSASGFMGADLFESARFKSSEKSIIGAYGYWASGLAEDPPLLSVRSKRNIDFKKLKSDALNKAKELISAPGIAKIPEVTTDSKYTYDGLFVEEISWQLPYGNRTRAILLKPEKAKGKLPGVLGLHDHGGNKYFGKRKITKTSDEQHPMMKTHQDNYYGGMAWANELAKRGYVVLVPDSFAFASRRVLFENMSTIPWGHCATEGLTDANPEKQAHIDAYNQWASEHEHILSKSLFCGGTTWPGVFFAEDKAALDVLSKRNDVDASSLGCAGLSGGGLRTVYLGGLDERIKCAIAVGFMTTWKDLLMNKAYTHTWMTYTPLLPKYLDFPEILGLRAPLPTMTLNNNQDRLFTLSEMKRADGILKEVFSKTGAPDHYKGGFYEGDHKFDTQMQKDAFDWFDQWLKS